MSLHELSTVAVGSLPRYIGDVESVISIKDVPLFTPMIAYSLPVVESIQPQQSLPASASISSRVIRPIKS